MNEVQKNAFGLPVYEIRDVLVDPEIEAVIQEMRCDVFKYLGIDDTRSDEVIDACLGFAKLCRDVTDYESSAHDILDREGVTKAIPSKLAERAKNMYDQIRPHLLEGSVLDLGCGDARLAQLLADDGYELQISDVYENSNIVATGLPFQLIGQNDTVPFADNQFDNSLLLTVLHHSDDPITVMHESQRVTRPGGRVIVIESVYGVNGKELEKAERAKIGQYLALTPEQQRRVQVFFDHFYNRVIHFSNEDSNKVNVSFNFNTPDAWKEFFAQSGLEQERVEHLGVDQRLVPEYHTLHVLSVS